MTHAGIATDGRSIYLAGGYVADAAWTQQVFGTPAVHRFDTVTGTWSRMPDLPYPGAAGGLVWNDGRLHYVGGTNQARTSDDARHLVLDVAAGGTTWALRAPLPTARNHLGAVAHGGQVYVVGGQKGHDGRAQMQSSVESYDPATDTWRAHAPLVTPRSHITSATFVLDGRIIVAGGQRQDYSPTAEVSAFNPVTGAWSTVTPLPAARTGGVGGAWTEGRWALVAGSNGWVAAPTAAP